MEMDLMTLKTIVSMQLEIRQLTEMPAQIQTVTAIQTQRFHLEMYLAGTVQTEPMRFRSTQRNGTTVTVTDTVKIL